MSIADSGARRTTIWHRVGVTAMNFTKDIERLCQQVSEEKDGDKLLALVDQLNKELEGMSEASAANDLAEQAADPTRRRKEHERGINRACLRTPTW